MNSLDQQKKIQIQLGQSSTLNPNSSLNQETDAAPVTSQQIIEIENTQILYLIAQFLKESNLHATLSSLQEGSKQSLAYLTESENDALLQNIRQGKWHQVLATLLDLELDNSLLFDLYEHIFLECCEWLEHGLAKQLLLNAKPLLAMRQTDKVRYLRLEELLHQEFEPKKAYRGVTKERRREQIAMSLMLPIATKSRLLELLSHALKYEKEKGFLLNARKYDLFLNKVISDTLADAVDVAIQRKVNTMNFTSASRIESVAFSASFLALGSVDGIVEFYNPRTGQLATELPYQAAESALMCSSAVLCLAFNTGTADGIAAGTQNGDVWVWRVANGVQIRLFSSVHAKGVTALCWANENQFIATAGLDHVIRILGLKSGRSLRECRGHLSFVNDVCWWGGNIWSVSSDTFLRQWNIQTGQCVSQRSVQESGSLGVSLLAVKSFHDGLVLAPRASFIVFVKGNDYQRLPLPVREQQKVTDVAGLAVSVQQSLIYVLGEDGFIYTWDVDKRQWKLPIDAKQGKEVIGISHSPFENVIVTWDLDGVVFLWR